MKKWAIALILAMGMGFHLQTSWAALQPVAAKAQSLAQNAPSNTAVDAMRENIPWGASQEEIESSFGEPDIAKPSFSGYRVQYEGTPMVLGYHFDEANRLFGASLTYPMPKTESGDIQNYMTLVSEYGQPVGVNEADQTPVWMLDNNLMMTLVNGDQVQSILLIQK